MWLLLPFALLVAGGWWGELGRLEGHLMPVVTDVRLVAQSMRPGETQFELEFTKTRTCTLRGMSIYVNGGANPIHRVPWGYAYAQESEQTDRSRPPGRHVAYLRAATGRPVDSWTVLVRHTCHPLYDTVTRIWPAGTG